MDDAKDNPVDKFKHIPVGQKLVELFSEFEEDKIAELQLDLSRRVY